MSATYGRCPVCNGVCFTGKDERGAFVARHYHGPLDDRRVCKGWGKEPLPLGALA